MSLDYIKSDYPWAYTLEKIEAIEKMKYLERRKAF